MTVTGERAIDQPRIEFRQFFIAEPKPAGDAGRIVFEEDIRLLRQLLKNFPPLIFLHIQRQAAFVAIEPNVTGGQTLHDRIPGANHIAHARSLDFDHLRPHVRQQTSRERPREHLLESKNLNSIQRSRGFRITGHTYLGFLE